MPRTKHSKKIIPWRLPRAAWEELKIIQPLLVQAEFMSEEWHELMDRMKSLPNYPLDPSAVLDPGEKIEAEVIDNPSTLDVH